jgi:hypothetical protein
VATRRSFALFIAAALLATSNIPARGTGGEGNGPSVSTAVHNDTSKLLRDQQQAPDGGYDLAGGGDVDEPLASGGGDVAARLGVADGDAAFALGGNFEGLSNNDNVVVRGGGAIPPDPTGEVGPDHYVQAVNLLVGVFDKSGVRAPGFPKALRSVWAGFGGACEMASAGDPIVLFDQLAGRWLITQQSFPNGGSTGPFYQCIAVSTTVDPTGAFHRYAFVFDDAIRQDYPKFGVWPDAYYMTVIELSGGASAGQGVVAFDRARMLDGLSATQVRFDLPGSPYRLLPSDVDGTRPPPAGAPNYVFSVADQHLQIRKFHVDFQTPANSTFTGPVAVPTQPYDASMCPSSSFNCIPQPGTSARLHGHSGGLMQRAAYRNFGTHEAIVLNHTVDVDGTDHAGVRWYELRSPGTSPAVFQQGTHAPDADHRWMGSAAMDGDGNLAIGYSVASATTFPSLRIAGRLSADPGGSLGPEQSIVAGAGSQTSSGGRWGDYSQIATDPLDDCTFWFTGEYYAATSEQGWRTRIASFRLPSCTPPAPAVADFDGDGDTDLSVFRPSTSQWFVQGSSPVSFGTSGDVPVPADYDADGDTDIAVFRPSVGGWYRDGGATSFFGLGGDVPVPADYDGDGDVDLAVFRPSVGGWYVEGQGPVFFGLSGDIPVPADYDGDGDTDIAVFRPSVGGWYRVGAATTFFGLSGDIPVPADYDGDGDGDIAVFRPSVGGWYRVAATTQFLGLNGDIPVPGNYDDGDAAEIAVFRPANGGWYTAAQPPSFFGISGDRPLPLPAAIRQVFFP